MGGGGWKHGVACFNTEVGVCVEGGGGDTCEEPSFDPCIAQVKASVYKYNQILQNLTKFH